MKARETKNNKNKKMRHQQATNNKKNIIRPADAYIYLTCICKACF